MAPAVADAIEALDKFEINYQTTPMGTTLEADDIDTILAAVAAAHKAVDADRVSTFLKVDDKRTVDQRAIEKVQDVEAELDRPAHSDTDASED